MKLRHPPTDLKAVADWLGLSSPQCAKFFGYGRSQWNLIENSGNVPDRLRYAIEAHYQLPVEIIEKYKNIRLKK